MIVSLADHDQTRASWTSVCSRFQFAFQAVVNTHTGVVFGYEALLRNWQAAGFDSIAQVFDWAHQDGVTAHVNALLLEKAIHSFAERSPRDARLLFNAENRAFADEDAAETLAAVISRGTLDAHRLCIEVSEQSPVPEAAFEEGHLHRLRCQGVAIALDDFGTGYSGLQVLYRAGVDLIKIDRFFVTNLARDTKRRIFVGNLLQMAHAMGIRVIAEGVETESEYYAVREIGCDFVQGFLFDRPRTDRHRLPDTIRAVDDLASRERRRAGQSGVDLENYLRVIEPISPKTSALEVLRTFRGDPELSFVPVVAEDGEPIGILHEQELKEYVYSPYGISLLMNRTYQREVFSYVKRVPVIDIRIRIARVLELYAVNPDAAALIVTRNGRYAGCLDSRQLLTLLHERDLSNAREQNPLSGLPGNLLIGEVIAETCRPICSPTLLVYLDFNDFKPFNDTYGFRIGDRVIQMFADHLRALAEADGWFVGHVGGDDFVAVVQSDGTAGGLATRIAQVRALVDRFREDVASVYTPADREQGYIEALDREGRRRRFPLLTVSAAALVIPEHDHFLPHADLSREITAIKRSAKRAGGALIAASLNAGALRDGCLDE